MDQHFWDELYRESDRRWSGAPNAALVAEVSALPPGRALDVGCGEGGDAHWLAERGWRVTAVDISPVALERAAAAGNGHGVEWVHADPLAAPPSARAYDLVTAHYLPIPHEPDHAAVLGLLGAVAPGGVLLFVGHHIVEVPPDWRGPDPSTFYQPGEVADLLDDEWTVEVNEIRLRPGATHHPEDVVLRARRT